MHKLSPTSLLQTIRNTINSSWQFFRSNPLVQDITLFDLVMQLSSFLLWNLYLSYTAVRCTILLVKYLMTLSDPTKNRNRQTVWSQIQLYTTTKVTGIVISQCALVFLGISTIGWAFCVLLWGALLGSISCFAYLRTIPK